MCLALPGKIVEFQEMGHHQESYAKTAKVSFGGVIKIINLSLVPEAAVGDYVIAHVGVAISQLDEEEAQKTLSAWMELNEMADS